MRTPLPCIAAVIALVSLGCSGSKDADTGDTGVAAEGCRGALPDPDRDRTVVVSTPYDSDGQPSDSWRQLVLTAGGELVDSGDSFRMGRANRGDVVFTPDGSLGFVAQGDGSIGQFQIDENGRVDVLQPGFRGSFYASRLAVDVTGETLWIVDPNWVVNGGGIYRADIDCVTGAISDPVLAIETKGAEDLLLLPGSTADFLPAVIAGQEVPGTNVGSDAGLVDLATLGNATSEADAFGDDDAIVGDAALTADGRHALISDISEFSGIPNRVAVVALEDGVLTAAQVLPDVYDPVGLVQSPWNDQVLVVSGYGDTYFLLQATGSASAPFTNAGEPTYSGSSPQLPTAAALVERGPLKGHVLVTENGGVRQVNLTEPGGFEDLGVTAVGTSFEGIAGVVGISP